MSIALNFINNSSEYRSQRVVIFQKNSADQEAARPRLADPHADPEPDPDSPAAVAWKVIQHCGVGENHPFSLPEPLQVSTGNDWGNHTPRLPAQSGQKFHSIRTPSGNTLHLGGVANNSHEVEVLNGQPDGAIDAQIYRDGKLLAVQSRVAPQQKAVFRFHPTLWIGLAPRAVQGEVMSKAQVSEINNEISLFGIASADIVMTGGGPGPDAMPFQFRLENIVAA